MADKNIKIRAQLDTQQFDQQINQLQQKFNNMARMQTTAQQTQNNYGANSGMSKLSKAFMGDFNQDSIKNLKEAFNINTRKMQHESREMQGKQRQIKELAKLEKDMTEGQKKRVKDLEKEVNLIKEKGRMMLDINNRMANQARGMGSDLSGFKGVDSRAGIPTNTGRMHGPNLPPSMMQKAGGFGNKMMAAMGGGTGIAGMALGGASMGVDYLSYQQTRDRQMMQNIGTTTRDSNIGFQSMMQNKGMMNAFESPERKAALDMAMSEREIRLQKDPLKAITSIGGSALGGAAVGGVAGSTFAGVGAIPGAIAGGIYSAGKAMLQPDNYKQIFDRDAYNAEVDADTMKNFRGNLTAMKMADPSKFAGAEMFQQRMGGYQNQQRRLGLGDTEFFGGAKDLTAPEFTGDETADQRAYQRSTALGQANQGRMGFMDRSRRDSSGTLAFSEQRIGRNINEILGAGGTTDFVTDQMGATMAAEYQRAGMTGAGRELGAISGTGEADTGTTYKKFLTDVFTTAMDDTELSASSVKGSEETRRLMSAVVGIYSQTGGAEGAGSEFLKGVTGMGGAEIAGAMSSFERRSAESGTGTGTRGALKWAYLNSAKGKSDFKGVDQDTMSALTSKSMKNLDEDDVNIKYAAQQAGVEPAEMLKRVRKLQRSGESYSAETEEAQGKFKAGYEKYLKDNEQTDNAGARKDFLDTKEGITLGGKSSALYYRERGDQAAQETAPAQRSTLFGTMGEISDDLKSKRKPGQLPPDQIAKAADAQEASKAADQEAQMQILNENMPRLVTAAEANTAANLQTKSNTLKAAESLDALMTYVNQGGDTENKGILEQMQKIFNPGGDGGEQPNIGKGKGTN